MFAPADRIYRALTNPAAVQEWLPPEGARRLVEALEPWAGGAFRMTLIFETPGAKGTRKSSLTTDSVMGEFLALIPNVMVRQRFEFESQDSSVASAMMMTWTLTSAGGVTDVTICANNPPDGINEVDHEVGMASPLANLAKYVEG
nr:SRPBCC domain-containing protein [Novosphingobium malaysiense]